MAEKQRPVTHKRGDEQVTTHPAFGQVRLVRHSGQARLYGSDFEHQHWMSLQIAPSARIRRYHEDSYQREAQSLVEIDLTESQWASLLSSVGLGEGVPCTLTRLNGKAVPGIEDEARRTEQFSAEVKESFEKAFTQLSELGADIESQKGLSGKAKAALQAKIQAARRELEANVPFAASQFAEYMEDTVSAAFTEINAHAQRQMQALPADRQALPVALEGRDDRA